MKLLALLAVIALSIITSIVTVDYVVTHDAGPAKTETSFERVMRTQTLRCGYEYWDGGIMKDEKTGQITGPMADVAEAIGRATGLKIEWTSQVGWADVAAALKSSKVDAICAGMWTSALKASQISFSTPYAYQAMEVFVRDDDHRFDGHLEKLNDPSVKLAVIENDNSDFVAQQDFPKAARDTLGQLNGTDASLAMEVVTGKADATFTVTGLGQQINKTNPSKIRALASDKRLRIYGIAMGMNNDDVRLRELINTGVQEIQYSNELNRILDKANQTWPDMYIKPSAPF